MPKFRIVQVVTDESRVANRLDSDPYFIERSFDGGKTWERVELVQGTYDEAAEIKRQWQQSWDGPNSYVG